jgi:hypothetical protein
MRLIMCDTYVAADCVLADKSSISSWISCAVYPYWVYCRSVGNSNVWYPGVIKSQEKRVPGWVWVLVMIYLRECERTCSWMDWASLKVVGAPQIDRAIRQINQRLGRLTSSRTRFASSLDGQLQSFLYSWSSCLVTIEQVCCSSSLNNTQNDLDFLLSRMIANVV